MRWWRFDLREAEMSFDLSGREAEVPLRSGGGHGEAGRAGEEDREGRGRVQALLGGPQAGQTGEPPVLGGGGASPSRVHRGS